MAQKEGGGKGRGREARSKIDKSSAQVCVEYVYWGRFCRVVEVRVGEERQQSVEKRGSSRVYGGRDKRQNSLHFDCTSKA